MQEELRQRRTRRHRRSLPVRRQPRPRFLQRKCLTPSQYQSIQSVDHWFIIFFCRCPYSGWQRWPADRAERAGLAVGPGRYRQLGHRVRTGAIPRCLHARHLFHAVDQQKRCIKHRSDNSQQLTFSKQIFNTILILILFFNNYFNCNFFLSTVSSSLSPPPYASLRLNRLESILW